MQTHGRGLNHGWLVAGRVFDICDFFLLGGEKGGYDRIRLGGFRSAKGRLVGLLAEPLGRNAAV